MSDPEIPSSTPDVPTPEIDPVGAPEEVPIQDPTPPDDGRPMDAVASPYVDSV